jgi:hypothetical protein
MSSAIAWTVISLPMVVLTSGQAMSAIFLGTGDAQTLGGTVLWELHLPSVSVLFVTRVMPLLVAVAGAWWVLRRFGDRALCPVPLISLAGASLALRLVFEKGLFGYKFMALAVMLIALDVVRGRLRGSVVVWIGLATLAFDPIPIGLQLNAQPWGHDVRQAAAFVFIGCALLWIIWDTARRRRPRWYAVAFVMVAAGAFLHWPPWMLGSLRSPLPKWLWQAILVPSGMALVLWPLVEALNRESEQAISQHVCASTEEQRIQRPPPLSLNRPLA